MTALRTGAATDVGRVRTNNEDQMLVGDTLFAVADGMGGHAAGEVASQAAVDVVEAAFNEDPTPEGLIAATQRANREIFDQAGADNALRGMGTTLTAAALVATEGDDGTAERLVVVNVGDSRAYLMRNGELSRVTDDHSVSEELVRSGQLTEAQAAVDNRRHVLTRVLGMDTDVTVDRFDLDPFRGDRLLLATDGLCNEVSDAEIASVLRRIEDPGEAARELVRLAKAGGGSDNITVVIVDVLDDDGRVEEATEALAREPARPQRLPTAAQRDARLRDLDAETRPASTIGNPEFVEAPRRRRLVRFSLFGLAVVLLLALGAGVVLFAQRNSYYVGERAGTVALYQGRPGGLLGFEPKVVRATDIELADLDGVARDRVKSGVTFSSRSQAEDYIERLPTTTTTSTTAPPPAPTSTPP